MREFRYCVKANRDIVNEGITSSLKEAKGSFKGFGRNSYGSITELNTDGTDHTEIGHKKIGGKLYCWE